MRDEEKSREQLIKELKYLRQEFKDKFEESLRREIISETFPDIFFLVNNDLKILDFKTDSEDRLYTTPDKFLNKKFREVLPEDTAILLEENISMVFKTRENQIVEYNLELNNEIKDFVARIIYFSYDKAAIFIRDVSELKYYQRAYIESETNYEEFAANLPQIAFQTDINANLTYVNNAAYRYFAYDENDIVLGKSILDFVAPEDRKRAIESIERGRSILRNQFSHNEYTAIRKDGSRFPIEIYATPIRKEEKLVGMRGIILDISQRKEIEKKIIKSEKRYRDLTELLPLGVFESDLDMNLVYINKNGLKLSGYTENEVYNCVKIPDFVIEDDKERVINNYYHGFLNGKLESDDYIGKKKDGTTYFIRVIANPIIIDGVPQGLRGILIDITEQKKAEEKLIEAQKMDSIGNLAAGVAHDFNNMLSGIMGYASLLLMDENDEELRGYISGIMNAARRSSDLTKKLLAFGRRGKNITQNIDLNEIIKRTIEILKRTASKSVKLEIKLEEKLGLIKADPSQMSQVLMNLCVNSLEAMKYGGILKISTKNVVVDENYESYEEIKKGDYIQLTISDTGTGMTEDVQKHLYEPFFTTKKDGEIKGTGLGLAIVYGIVKNHGGTINYETIIGKKTKFIILLPKSDNLNETKSNVSEITDEEENFTGKILIVEDEKTVRYMLEKMVNRLGYSFISAKDGLEGVELYKQYFNSIDIVILDMKMPNLDGKGAYIEMKKINPNLKVILMTGYGHNEEAQEILDLGANMLILKPYSITKLKESIKEVLRK